jgi:excisionase family DNA binding protein
MDGVRRSVLPFGTMNPPKAPPAPPGLSVEEALARTGVARATLYRAIATGALVSHKVGRRRIIPVAELDAWNKPRRKAAAWLGEG